MHSTLSLGAPLRSRLLNVRDLSGRLSQSATILYVYKLREWQLLQSPFVERLALLDVVSIDPYSSSANPLREEAVDFCKCFEIDLPILGRHHATMCRTSGKLLDTLVGCQYRSTQ